MNRSRFDLRRAETPLLLVLSLAAASLGCSSIGGSDAEPGADGSTGASSGAGGGDSSATAGQGAGQGSAGSTGSGEGGGPTYPPGPPGCGLDAAAFCETFDAPAGAATRAGELDPARWSASRMCEIGLPSNNGEAVGIGTATVPPCRSGLPAQVLPSDDAIICDGNDQLQSNHLLVLVAAQNYGQNSYRIRQPFDFTGRTGTIVFDAEGRREGEKGWISIEITEDPTPAPSFTIQQNFENGSIPENGVEIQLYITCGGDTVGVSEIIVYDSHHQTRAFSDGTVCVPTGEGRLNHFEVRLSTDHVEVYGTPASEDGSAFEPPVLLGSADVALPFSRGYVHLTTHNHATLKYSDNTLDAWHARWDNVGFDGPAITSGWREHEVLDALNATATGKVNVGWRLADASTGPAQTLQIPGVDLSGVVAARMALQNWSLPDSAMPPETFALNYRLNGHPWKERKLTASEVQMMADLPNAGTRSLMLDVDVADLVPGTNTLEFTTSNAPMGYPPVVLNIDLVLETE